MGWIKNKFDCPVAPNVIVEIRFRSGVKTAGNAGDWYWKRHQIPEHEITHYRIKEKTND